MSKVCIQGPRAFSPKEIGNSLMSVASDIIEEEGRRIISCSFHSNLDLDLHVWHDEADNILKQQVLLYGQIIEWNLLEGVKTGYIAEEENGIGIHAGAAYCFDKQPIVSSVNQVLSLIDHMCHIDEGLRQKMKHNFVYAPEWSLSSEMDFAQQFGCVEDPQKTKSVVAQIISKLAYLFR